MHIGRIAVAGAAAAAMITSGAGLTAASASTARPAAASGTEHLSLMSTEPSASKLTVIASGLFTAAGTDRSGSKTDTTTLPGGTFKIRHGGPLHVIKEQLNQRTCLMQFAVTTKFTLGGGTGAYKGISGSGKALISGIGIARRVKGTCDPNVTPAAQEETITGTGHVTL
jgi:hypothetical protein